MILFFLMKKEVTHAHAQTPGKTEKQKKKE